MYIHTCTYIYVCIDISIYKQAYLRIYDHIYIYVYTHICTCIYICIDISIYKQTYLHIYDHVYIGTITHTHTHTHVYVRVIVTLYKYIYSWHFPPHHCFLWPSSSLLWHISSDGYRALNIWDCNYILTFGKTVITLTVAH